MKKIISLLVTLTMLMGMLSGLTAVYAAGSVFPEAGDDVVEAGNDDFVEKFNTTSITAIKLKESVNITQESGLTLQGHNLYLDLNGNTLTIETGTAYQSAIIANTSLTITDTSGKKGVLNYAETSTSHRSAIRIGGGNVKIENVKIISSSTDASYGAIFFSSNNANVKIENAEIETASNVVINNAKNATLTMGGDTYIHGTGTNAPKLSLGADATVIITGGKYSFDPTEYLASGYKATEDSGIWTVAQEEGKYVVTGTLQGDAAGIAESKVTLKEIGGNSNEYETTVSSINENVITFSGVESGTYTVEAEAAEGYVMEVTYTTGDSIEISDANVDGEFAVVVHSPGSEKNPYEISDADTWKAAASNSGSSPQKAAHFKLTKDITDTDISAVLFQNSGATLDMNGHSITTAANKLFNLNSVTIRNSSETKSAITDNVTGSGSYVMLISGVNGTSYNIENVTITADCSQVIMVGGNSPAELNIKNSEISGAGKGLFLQGGTTTIEGKDAKVTGRGDVAIAAVNANLTIKDGTFNGSEGSKRHTISVGGSGNVVIDGGTFTNPNSEGGVISINNGFSGTLTISGGVFENAYDPVTAGSGKVGFSISDGNNAADSTGTINITGGTFKSGLNRVNGATTQITITGGTFSFDPTAYVPTEGDVDYVVRNNGDGTWTVTDIANIEIDYEKEMLTGFADEVDYTINGTGVEPENGELAIDEDYYGETITIVGTMDEEEKLNQELEIPARPEAPTGVECVEPTEVGGQGSVTGITEEMEYSTDNGESWADASELTDNTLTVSGGTMVLVRTKADNEEEKFASAAAEITIHVRSSVTLNAGDGIIADGKDVTSYLEGVGETLTAADDVTRDGYTFAGWYADASYDGDAVTEIPAAATGSLTYYAKWTADSHIITNNAPESDKATNNGYVNVAASAVTDEEVTVTVVPNYGYELTELMIGSDDVTEEVADGKYIFTMPTDDITISVTFDRMAPASITVTGSRRVTKGNTAVYTAKVLAADEETNLTELYKDEIEWEVTGGITDTEIEADSTDGNKATLTLAAEETAENVTITASVDEIEGTIEVAVLDVQIYSITVSQTTHGTVTADPDSAEAGEEITLTIAPADDYELETLIVDSDDVTDNVDDNKYTFNMPEHEVTVEATFIQAVFTVTLDAGAGSFAGGEKTAAVKVDKGEKITAVPEVTPAANYELTGWKLKDGADVTGDLITDLTAEDIAADVTYVAQYAFVKHTVTFVVDGQETEVKVTYGDTAESVKPNDPVKSGYNFLGWVKGADTTQDVVATWEPIIADGVVYTAKFEASAEPSIELELFDLFKATLEIKADKTNSGVVLTASAKSGELPDLKAYVAVYDNGKLKGIQVIDFVDGKASIAKPTGDYKLMLWTDSLTPVINAITASTTGVNGIFTE